MTVNALFGKPKPVWRIGTTIGGVPTWEAMRAGGYVAIGWSTLDDLSGFANGDYAENKLAITHLLETDYPNTPSVNTRKAGEILNFVSKCSTGEVVAACEGETVLGVGRITGPYYLDRTNPTAAPHRRPVEWISFDEWRMPQPDGPHTTVWDFRNYENLAAIEQKTFGAAPIEQLPAPAIPADHAPRPRLEGIPARIQAILERKGQAILYGPPGTGKTYWARKAAHDLVALETYGRLFENLTPAEKVSITGSDDKPGLVRCCTFHPAYGYEDFLEAFRPAVGPTGQLIFEPKDGIFKRLCEDASKDTSNRKYILLIDEINRGDIPRIFGELLTLLELDKRGSKLFLPLSGQSFQVPKNVYVLGTMNTADRSIALLDTALRRRFGFVELMPDVSVLGGARVDGSLPLGPWLSALNERIRTHLGRDGRNLQVGHAYFLVNDRPIRSMAKFVQVLAEDLIPLLEEYCYDDYHALTQILGEGLVDEPRQCIREELLDPGRSEDLIHALLSTCPEVATSVEASAVSDALESDGSDNEDSDL